MENYKNIIDISYCQPNVNWSQVNVDAIIIKAGQRDYTDPMFESHYKNAKAKGIPVGAYWFLDKSSLTVDAARKEADEFIKRLDGKQFEYPVYLDLEANEHFALGRTMVSKIIRAFLERVESAGYWVGLYGSYSSLTTYTEPDIRSRYAIWLAHWGVQKSPYNGEYGLWQTGVGRTAGINGDVDIDRGYVDYPKLIKEKGLNGFSKTTQTGTAPSAQEPKKPVSQYSCPYKIPSKTLRKGDKGDGVKWVQFNLNYLGFSCGKYGVDGSFGNDTDKAVRKFQESCKIAVDGICGPITKSLIIMKTSGESQYDSSGYKPRLTKPESGNPYYNTTARGGYSTAIVGKPTDSGCNVLANCVGYAAGRFNEIIGENTFKYFQYPPNAENFYDIAKTQGLTISQEPKLGAIMCWQKGKTRSYTDGAGHVAVVEQIISGTEVITSESGYGCATPFWTSNRKKGNGNWGAGSNYTFLGFILNPAVK